MLSTDGGVEGKPRKVALHCGDAEAARRGLERRNQSKSICVAAAEPQNVSGQMAVYSWIAPESSCQMGSNRENSPPVSKTP